jgi:chloramphenicol-sensitive protein RarD
MPSPPAPIVSRQDSSRGIAAALGAFGLWGMLPLYWKALGSVSADEQMSHRILWTVAVMVPIILATGRMSALRAILRQRKTVAALLFSTVCIGLNWYVFIWGVSQNRVLETSLGYYINPLVSALIGCIVLRERFSRGQAIGIALAGLGVLWSVVGHGGLPWLSLSLAMLFALYGLARKLAPVDPACCVFVETLLLAPIAAGSLAGTYAQGQVPGMALLFMLMLSGPLTLLPMLAFNYAAQRVRLTVLGLTQYLSPTFSLFLGIWVFREPFDLRTLVTFGFIWAGLIVFTLTSWRQMRLPRG